MAATGAAAVVGVATGAALTTYIRADVREEADGQRFVDAVAERYGGLDACFNNAGITIQKPLHEYTSAEWDDVINTPTCAAGSSRSTRYPTSSGGVAARWW
ncbi:SDR family NAD(P)-dependent oxidoreductase [Pseudonocardia adelaidensis]|uniref:Short subunit dehydrogenase n=1 Tax=Pseudonocardia adelaidensis TaxID=648754 RepID=A0ABP9NXW0_9PSEU